MPFMRKILLASVIALATAPQMATSPCGRYQLFHGATGFQNEMKLDVILRIDTQTGQTWVYINSVNRSGDGWMPVGDFHEQ
jgi:hypothetical protein